MLYLAQGMKSNTRGHAHLAFHSHSAINITLFFLIPSHSNKMYRPLRNCTTTTTTTTTVAIDQHPTIQVSPRFGVCVHISIYIYIDICRHARPPWFQVCMLGMGMNSFCSDAFSVALQEQTKLSVNVIALNDFGKRLLLLRIKGYMHYMCDSTIAQIF